MAQSGMITAARNSGRDLKIKILGVTQGSTSPTFGGDGYPVGSYTAQGTFQTSSAPTVGLYGSNDGGTTWFPVAATFTAAQSGSMIGLNNEIFELYQFQVTGGDAGTSINFFVFLSATFG
jgi:hypothetical protein